MKQKSSMKKRLRQFLHPLYVYVEKFMNLQLVTYKGLKTSKKDFDRRRLSSSEIQVGDLILLYNNKRKDKKEGKFSLHDLVLLSFPKLHSREL